MTPTELAPWLYARGNPLQFKDPLGLGTFCEDRYGTSDTIICAARSAQQYQFERQLQAERAGNAAVAAEAKQLWRQAAKDEQSRAQIEDFHRNVFQPVFFTAVSAAPVAQVGAAVPLIGKGLTLLGTLAASYKGTEVVTGEKTEFFAQGGPKVVPYKPCTSAANCERGWDAVSASGELFLSFAAGAHLQAPQRNVTLAPRKSTWEDFLPAAKERVAAAKQEYGELGLQMSAATPENSGQARVVYRALNPKDAARLEAGLGLEARNPAGALTDPLIFDGQVLEIRGRGDHAAAS